MRFVRSLVIGLLVVGCAATGWTEDYKLANGNTLSGEIASADEDGMIVKLDIGGFSTRQPWVSFSQETLRELRQDPRYAEYVEMFIELTADEIKQLQKRREIVIRDVDSRIERPTPAPSVFTGFVSPIGFLILALLLGANLYAAYEIAQFRKQNVIAVCGLSLVLPVVGPIIFLSLPTTHPESTSQESLEEDLASSSLSAPAEASAAGGLSLAAAERSPMASAQTQPQVFQRGDNTFNRRFFETKFPGFFRVVLGEAERDLVLVFRTPKQEFVGKRISRIATNELHLVLLAGGEKSISFNEITSVILKHKDAKIQ